MNPGYLSLVLISMTLILFASGWKDVLIRGISHKAILLFFISWFAVHRISFEWRGFTIYAPAVLLLIVSAIVVLRTDGMLQRCHLLSMGLLVGSVYFFLLEASQIVPVLMTHSELQLATVLALTAVLLTRSGMKQLACLSIGFIIGESYFAFVHMPQGYEGQVAGLPFQDRWWLTLWIARGCTLGLLAAQSGCRVAWKSWADRHHKGGTS